MKNILFRRCEKLKDILLPYEENVLNAAIDRFKILDRSFLKRESVQLPKEKHWPDLNFRNLAGQCSVRNVEAIEGAVEVSAYDSEDGLDGDGFGREVYYKVWD